MQSSFGQRPMAAPAIVGLLLIAVGAVVLAGRQVGIDPFASVAAWGWPLFVIVPGLVLLAAALVPSPPRGIGFAIAGAIVTTVGLVLLYQSRSGDWESWAYAWAFIPLAAGAALFAYGLYARSSSMVRGGTWLAGIAALLLAIGAWFFQGLFAGELRPDFAEAWPLALIALGALVLIRAFVVPGEVRDAGKPADPA